MLLPWSNGHLHRNAAAFTVSLGCPLLSFLRPSRLCKRITSRPPPAKGINHSIILCISQQSLQKSQELSCLHVLLLENSKSIYTASLAFLRINKRGNLRISNKIDRCFEGQAKPRESCELAYCTACYAGELNSSFSINFGYRTRCISFNAHQSQQQIVDRLLLPSFAVLLADALQACLRGIPPGPVSS